MKNMKLIITTIAALLVIPCSTAFSVPTRIARHQALIPTKSNVVAHDLQEAVENMEETVLDVQNSALEATKDALGGTTMAKLREQRENYESTKDSMLDNAYVDTKDNVKTVPHHNFFSAFKNFCKSMPKVFSFAVKPFTALYFIPLYFKRKLLLEKERKHEFENSSLRDLALVMG
jgi:hypothetical protein